MDIIASKSSFAKDVRSIFTESGISIAEWVRAEGFSTAFVYQVIEGGRQCVRGQSHRIAVALGLKQGVICNLEQFKRRLAEFSANAGAQTKESDM